MSHLLTEEQRTFLRLAEEFADNELAPHAAKWDREHIFPIEALKQAARLGFAGIYVDANYGGSQLTRLDASFIFESLARACVSTTAYLTIHNMVAWIIDEYGNERLKKRYLPNLCTMETLGSYCLTEPQSGSDAASLSTTAKREGNEYVLNGTKAFISGGSTSDIYLCMVRTGDKSTKGISCLLVEKDTPGLSFGNKENKLGWHSQSTTMVFFENCRVPVENLIGAEGQGFSIAMSALNGGRINIAACSVGGAKACLQYAKHYMNDRRQFNHKLNEFQALQFVIADMHTELDAARLLVQRAAISLDSKHPEYVTHCAMAKRYATDVGFSISDRALQMLGGYGYLNDYPIERFFRDLRVHQLLEGTNEIMRVIISRRVLQDDFEMD
jgi:alkylation response protein AidB-like acyl-CoA dehydrogenase